MATPCLVSTDSCGAYSIRFLYLSKWHPINISHGQHFCLGWVTKEKETWMGEEDKGRIHHKRTNFRKAKNNVSLIKWKRIEKIIICVHIGISVEGKKKKQSKYLALVLSFKKGFSKSHEIWLFTNCQLVFIECPFRHYHRHFISITSNPYRKKKSKNTASYYLHFTRKLQCRKVKQLNHYCRFWF